MNHRNNGVQAVVTIAQPTNHASNIAGKITRSKSFGLVSLSCSFALKKSQTIAVQHISRISVAHLLAKTLILGPNPINTSSISGQTHLNPNGLRPLSLTPWPGVRPQRSPPRKHPQKVRAPPGRKNSLTVFPGVSLRAYLRLISIALPEQNGSEPRTLTPPTTARNQNYAT
jgi:hypothetical protein